MGLVEGEYGEAGVWQPPQGRPLRLVAVQMGFRPVNRLEQVSPGSADATGTGCAGGFSGFDEWLELAGPTGPTGSFDDSGLWT